MKMRKVKGEFDELEGEWKDGITSMSTEEIDSRIAEIAKAESENQKNKKLDPHLKECRLAVKMASEGYNEQSKMSKLRIGFCMRVLSDRGK